MTRWAHTFEGDSPSRLDGDRGFLRMRSRLDGAALEPGELELVENGRLDRGSFRVRRGARRLNEEFTGVDSPLVVPFDLGHEVEVYEIVRAGSVATVTTVGDHNFETDEKIAIEGADQEEYNGDFFITVTAPGEFTYEVSGAPASPATGDEIIAANGPVLREVYGDGVFAAGVFSNPEDDHKEWIALATGIRLFLLREGEDVVEVPYPTDETIQPEEVASVVDANSVLYVFREGKRPLRWDGVAAEMELVPGALSNFDVTSLTRDGNTATAVTAEEHNYETGDLVTIEGADQEEYNGTHEIEVTGGNEFAYEVEGGPTTPATGDITARRDAFRGIPKAGWALWFGNRMLTPYRRDEFLASDVFDPANYDMIAGHFRVNIGTSDFLVALHPYQDDGVLVFMRKSIHLVSGIRGDLENAQVTEITREVGCIARRSIVTAGRFVFFLSDQGVYALEIGHELNLRGAMRPLSESIQDVMREIPLERAGGAHGVFWDNRYFLAVPGPESPFAAGGTARNDRVLVYSILNEGWESVDVYPDALWLDWLVVSFREGSRRLFGANFESFLYLLEDLDGFDEVGTPGSELVAQAPVRGFARSRVYQGNAPGLVKLWLRAQAELVLPEGAGARARGVSRGPDFEGEWVDIDGAGARLRRFPLRQRGEGLQIEAELPGGRGELFGLAVEGVETGRSMVRY